jgi:uncharacterized membrane protein
VRGVSPFETLIKAATIDLATAIEAGAAVIIAFATIRAAAHIVAQRSAEDVRMNLGRGLSLALEFEVAADILRTAIAPTWTQIGQLAAIVALRTALNYVLQREIGSERKEELA